ncbi:MAG: RNA polymerase sigma factor [Pirellulales bacterium]
MHRTTDREATSKAMVDDPLIDVVQRCLLEDRGAQRELYEACHPAVYRLMLRMVGRQEADDLTQQAFLQAFRRLEQFGGRSRFETWLYRLAVNEALQHLRKESRSKQQHLVEEPADHRREGGEAMVNKELLERALQRLDPDLRSVFLLREVEKLGYRDLADVMDVPEGTIASRLNRARRLLQDHLVELGWEP